MQHKFFEYEVASPQQQIEPEAAENLQSSEDHQQENLEDEFLIDQILNNHNKAVNSYMVQSDTTLFEDVPISPSMDQD